MKNVQVYSFSAFVFYILTVLLIPGISWQYMGMVKCTGDTASILLRQPNNENFMSFHGQRFVSLTTPLFNLADLLSTSLLSQKLKWTFYFKQTWWHAESNTQSFSENTESTPLSLEVANNVSKAQIQKLNWREKERERMRETFSLGNKNTMKS